MPKIQHLVEQAIKKEEAILRLKSLGVLVDFDEKLNLFHGRVNSDGENFFVDPSFDNAGQTLGHYNNNAIPGLHASDYEIARLYAENRYAENATTGNVLGKVEVHKIEPTTNGLMILNVQKLFDVDELEMELKDYIKISKTESDELKKIELSNEEKEEVKQAVKVIAEQTGPQKLLPKLFGNKESVNILKDMQNICEKNKKDGKPYVLDDDLESYIIRKGANEKLEAKIRDISGAVNVYQILKEEGNIKMLVSKLQSNFDFTEDMSLNLDLFEKFLKSENIIGIKQKLWLSNVINKNNFDDYFFFDTKRINSSSAIKKMKNDSRKQIKTETTLKA